MLALTLALASLATDVSWTDRSGQCPASAGQTAVEAAAGTFDEASIVVDVEATDDGLAATVRLETPNGVQTRTLRSPACDTLVEATVLITRAAAMAAIVPDPRPPPDHPEPELLEPESSPPVEAGVVADPKRDAEPNAQPRPLPAVAAEPQTPPGPARIPRAAGRLFASLRAFGFGTFGTTPGLGGGGGLGVGVGAPRWRAELSSRISAPTDTTGATGIQAWAWALGAHGCPTFDVLGGRWEPGVCGGVEAGEQLGEGTSASLVNAQPQRGPWLAATLGPTLRAFVIPGFAVVLDVDAVVSILRPGFRVRNSAPTQPNVVAPRVSLGLELRLPRL